MPQELVIMFWVVLSGLTLLLGLFLCVLVHTANTRRRWATLHKIGSQS